MYKQKIRKRLYCAAAYLVIGIAAICVRILGITDNEFMLTLGIAFGVSGLARMLQYLRLMASGDKMREREIAEQDERNIMLWQKARSITFGIFTLVSGTAVMVLYIIGQNFAGQIVAYCLCGLAFIYWLCYMILKRKY